jgi:hypothetical protein
VLGRSGTLFPVAGFVAPAIDADNGAIIFFDDDVLPADRGAVEPGAVDPVEIIIEIIRRVGRILNISGETLFEPLSKGFRPPMLEEPHSFRTLLIANNGVNDLSTGC